MRAMSNVGIGTAGGAVVGGGGGAGGAVAACDGDGAAACGDDDAAVCGDDGAAAGGCAIEGAGLTPGPRPACSLRLPCHATPNATARTTAPAATSQITVRDISLPMCDHPPPFGVATFLCEMIPCRRSGKTSDRPQNKQY